MNCTRRDLLKFGAGAAAIAATGLSGASLFAGEAKKIPVGLQLYSLRDIISKDVPGTLAKVAEMGYQGVEFAGYYNLKANALRKLLDSNGLKACGTHAGLNALKGDTLKATVEFNQTIGNNFLVVPSLPRAIMSSIASLMETAKFLTEVSERVKESGMRVGYHAHGGDFRLVADRVPWDVIFGNAGPQVIMQLDTGNCMEGGGDPVAVLKKYPGRSLTVHLKEFGGPKGAVLGEGKVPWKEILDICETTGGTQWYVIEQETFRHPPLESVKMALDNLHKLGR